VSLFLRRWGWRTAGLVITAVGLYIVTPALVSVLDAWPQVKTVRWGWFVLLFLLEAGSFVALWGLVRITLPHVSWFVAGTSQLAGTAASRILPGGGATGGVVQATMLVRAGHPGPAVARAMGTINLLTTAVLLALPVFTIPAVVLRPPPARQLQLGLVVSLIVGVLIVLLGLALLHWDSFVHAIGRLAGRAVHVVRRKIAPVTVERGVVEQRDHVAAAFRGQWTRSLSLAAANRMLDYAALCAALYAVHVEVRPSMVLLAYVISMALALVPVTPGGLGFVEAGLTTVLVLAGVPGDKAILATLVYRLFSFWLPVPIGALAWAGFRLHGPPFPRTAPDEGVSDT
jgi:uncharacterized protein (TIRG00374 family)